MSTAALMAIGLFATTAERVAHAGPRMERLGDATRGVMLGWALKELGKAEHPYCWRDSEVKQPSTATTCGANQELSGGLCYEKCRPGYTSNGANRCYKDCPAGTFWRTWGFCEDNQGRVWRECPYQFPGTGLTGLTPSCINDNFTTRPTGTIPGCAPGKTKSGALCYDACKPGYNNLAGVCWQSCASTAGQPNACGAACTQTAGSCASETFNQILSVIDLAANIAELVGTGGTANAAKASAKTAAKTAGKAAAKMAAKRSVRDVAKNLMEKKVRKTLAQRASKYGKELGEELMWSAAESLAVSGLSGEFDLKDFLVDLDPTGVAAVVEAFRKPVCEAPEDFNLPPQVEAHIRAVSTELQAAPTGVGDVIGEPTWRVAGVASSSGASSSAPASAGPQSGPIAAGSCCWNRANQSCTSHGECDAGGEGCRASGSPTQQYGNFACSTCENRGQVYDRATGACKAPAVVSSASSGATMCCWNRAVQSCSASGECDGGGEGCRASGSPTQQYGNFACSTCESRGQTYDRATGACKAPAVVASASSGSTMCCWNRAVQSCSSSGECDAGGEGCRASGSPTQQYGNFACSTCESRGLTYDRATSACKPRPVASTSSGSTSGSTMCCWNRAIQSCSSSGECDGGGEGCRASGTHTQQYGAFACDTCESRGLVYDRATSACKPRPSPGMCCWNRAIQSCSSSSDCDGGGEGCRASGTPTQAYGAFGCDTCESRGQVYDRSTSSCRADPAAAAAAARLAAAAAAAQAAARAAADAAAAAAAAAAKDAADMAAAKAKAKADADALAAAAARDAAAMAAAKAKAKADADALAAAAAKEAAAMAALKAAAASKPVVASTTASLPAPQSATQKTAAQKAAEAQIAAQQAAAKAAAAKAATQAAAREKALAQAKAQAAALLAAQQKQQAAAKAAAAKAAADFEARMAAAKLAADKARAASANTAPPAPAACKTAHALSLAGGTQGVELGNVAPFQLEKNTPVSIEGWVYLKSGYLTLLSKNYGTKNWYIFGVNFDAQRGKGFLMAQFGNTWPTNAIQVNSAFVVPANTWVHVAFTYNGSSRASGVQLYLNGVLQRPEINKDTLSASMANAAPAFVGKGAGSTNGMLSDVRIWRVARTAAQLSASMKSCLSGTEANLVAHYPLRECAGLTATNTVKGAPLGKLIGGATAAAWVATPPPGLACAGAAPAAASTPPVSATPVIPAKPIISTSPVTPVVAPSAPAASTFPTCAPNAERTTAGACGKGAQKCFFLTSCKYTGAELGGLSGADAKCQGHADAAGLGGTFKAWLSTAAIGPASPGRMTPGAVPYKSVTGKQIAASWAALTSGSGGLNAPGSGGEPNKVESGAAQGSEVWTNTSTRGTPASGSDCGGWTSTNGSAPVGHSNYVDAGRYTTMGSAACSAARPLYCVEQ